MARDDAEDCDVHPGDILAGKYFVLKMIGRGAMGVVVEAKHANGGERVAIKILRERYLNDDEARARFAHEARASVRIRGEHTARLIEVGNTRSGAPFIVMELLLGSDLSQILREGALEVSDAVLYVLQACEGMAEVHGHGIIHRDLKPGNLFITRRVDGTPLVKVLDFGIAKSSSPTEESDPQITMTFVALGTPLYMSPEQIRCSKTVDARTDIWSLGAILYELIAGKPAFGGNSLTNIAAQVLESQPISLLELRPEVPPELDRVIFRALSKQPEGRFAEIATFARALAPFAGEAGAHHASRAARLLRGEARGAFIAPRPTSTPSSDTPPESGSSALPEATAGSREDRDTQLPAQKLGLVLLTALLVLIIGVLLVTQLGAQSQAPLRALPGIQAQTNALLAKVSATFRAPPAPGPGRAAAALAAPPSASNSEIGARSATPGRAGRGHGATAPGKGRSVARP